MAYKPDAATEAALAKSRKGQTLSAPERSLILAHSQHILHDGWYANGLNLKETDVDGQLVNPPTKAVATPTTPKATTPAQSGVMKTLPVVYNNPYQNPTSSPNPGVPSNPLPAVNPGVNGNVGPVPTQTPFSPSAALPSAPKSIYNDYGGVNTGYYDTPGAGVDVGRIVAEAELQKSLAGQTLDQQSQGRKAMLDDLSGVLQKQQSALMNDQMPGIYEDLNTRGLLRSSALGEKVGLEASKLARQTSEQLAVQGLQDRGKTIDSYGDIENAYFNNRNSAMQRGFSLEDYSRQLSAAKELGSNATPQVAQPSGKGAGALQGGLGGATVGANFGPQAAVAGGILGMIGGGKLGGKS